MKSIVNGIVVLASVLLALSPNLAGCGGRAASDGDAQDGDTISDGDSVDGDMPEGPFHDPWTVMPPGTLPSVRGLRVARGIIHCHSPYSHDACDDEPFIGGVRNAQCFEDVRRGMCATGQDFVFMTDHASLFADYEFPDVLLWKEGDTLVERNGYPVANRVACPDGGSVLMLAGTETGSMPIGLERHVGATPAERHAAYDDTTPAGLQRLKEAGALTWVQHTEGWDVETLAALPLDGIENYNLHQNLMDNMGKAIGMVLKLATHPEELPVPELGIIGIFQESEADLFRWSKLLGLRRQAAGLATDSHRNVFDGVLDDGDRLDSFRRMMHWFSNYALIEGEGPIDDRALKQAVGRGRMYGSFDYLGYPIGFDFHAEQNGTVYEMGDDVPAAPAQLMLNRPSVWRLDPAGPQPVYRTRILRAADGAWEEVASGTGDLAFTADRPGSYRAEVRIVPHHLRPWLGPEADEYLVELIWVYSNPVYVATGY